jgi:ESCRT-II complex subunit VPS22
LKNRYAQKKADEMKALSYQTAIDTIETLEQKLSEFAIQHQNLIRTDPVFRARFLAMCAPLGVDPLQSTNNGNGSISSSSSSSSKKNQSRGWLNIFGTDLSDYYHELAVKVAEVCLAHRKMNGGIMSMSELQRLLIQRTGRLGNFSIVSGPTATSSSFNSSSSSINNKKKTKNKDENKPLISVADIEIAIEKLAKLGGGFRTVKVGDSIMVISVPTEFDSDHTNVLSIAKNHAHAQTSMSSSMADNNDIGITMDHVKKETGWSHDRVERAMDLLMQHGMAWVDENHGEKYYWFPSIWQESQSDRPTSPPF